MAVNKFKWIASYPFMNWLWYKTNQFTIWDCHLYIKVKIMTIIWRALCQKQNRKAYLLLLNFLQNWHYGVNETWWVGFQLRVIFTILMGRFDMQVAPWKSKNLCSCSIYCWKWGYDFWVKCRCLAGNLKKERKYIYIYIIYIYIYVNMYICIYKSYISL